MDIKKIHCHTDIGQNGYLEFTLMTILSVPKDLLSKKQVIRCKKSLLEKFCNVLRPHINVFIYFFTSFEMLIYSWINFICENLRKELIVSKAGLI